MAAAGLLTKVVALGVPAVIACVVSAPHQALAATGSPVHIEVATSFDPTAVNTFTADITGCASGTVTERRVTVSQGRGAHNVFNGEKVFACAAGGTFTLQLNARYPVGPGSVGTWSLTGSSGLGLTSGSGKLVGYGTPDGILDVYDGTFR
jgi:hypothetical protein